MDIWFGFVLFKNSESVFFCNIKLSTVVLHSHSHSEPSIYCRLNDSFTIVRLKINVKLILDANSRFFFDICYLTKSEFKNQNSNNMKKLVVKLSFSLFALGVSNVVVGQVDKDVLNWYNNSSAGMKTEKAYKKLKKRTSTTVIVAVIDSGIDIEHEDLKGKIWVNADEIPGNGIDDDNNGYIDDVHGWNFLGNPSGVNQQHANLEKTRIYKKLRDKYERLEASQVKSEDKAEYE
jgi:hypothetical protein